jgi:hypothetical protein
LAIQPAFQRVVESTNRRRKILQLVQESIGQLRLDIGSYPSRARPFPGSTSRTQRRRGRLQRRFFPRIGVITSESSLDDREP